MSKLKIIPILVLFQLVVSVSSHSDNTLDLIGHSSISLSLEQILIITLSIMIILDILLYYLARIKNKKLILLMNAITILLLIIDFIFQKFIKFK